MKYSSPMPTNPSDRNFYPFNNFVSSTENTRKNLEALGLTAEELGIPNPEIYVVKSFEKAWEHYNELSMNASQISEHSWNVQLLNQYRRLFDLHDNHEQLIDIFNNHIGKLTTRNRDPIIRFLDGVEKSKQINEKFIKEESELVEKEHGEEKIVKRAIFDVYLSMFINHIQSANPSTYSKGNDDAINPTWNGTDKLSGILLNRINAFQNMYSSSVERDVENFIQLIQQYPQIINLLPGEKQSILRERLINWQLTKLNFTIEGANFNRDYQEQLPATLDVDFFDSFDKLSSQISACNQMHDILKNTYGIHEEVIKQTLQDAWNEHKTVDALITSLTFLEEVEKVKAFLSEQVSEEHSAELSELKPLSVCSEETQTKLFKQCFEHWANDERNDKGQHHYELCIQALERFNSNFETVNSPIEVIEAITKNLELAQKYTLKLVEQCKIMEYELDSFSPVLAIEKSMEDIDDSATEKKVILEVIQKIKELKQLHFYNNGKPKLIQDISHREDVLKFYLSASQYIEEKAKEISDNQPLQEKLLTILKIVFNFACRAVSFGKYPNFFETEPKETVEVKAAICALHENIIKELSQPEMEMAASESSLN